MNKRDFITLLGGAVFTDLLDFVQKVTRPLTVCGNECDFFLAQRLPISGRKRFGRGSA